MSCFPSAGQRSDKQWESRGLLDGPLGAKLQDTVASSPPDWKTSTTTVQTEYVGLRWKQHALNEWQHLLQTKNNYCLKTDLEFFLLPCRCHSVEMEQMKSNSGLLCELLLLRVWPLVNGIKEFYFAIKSRILAKWRRNEVGLILAVNKTHTYYQSADPLRMLRCAH